jgi:hypothetical protein
LATTLALGLLCVHGAGVCADRLEAPFGAHGGRGFALAHQLPRTVALPYDAAVGQDSPAAAVAGVGLIGEMFPTRLRANPVLFGYDTLALQWALAPPARAIGSVRVPVDVAFGTRLRLFDNRPFLWFDFAFADAVHQAGTPGEVHAWVLLVRAVGIRSRTEARVQYD